MELPRQCETGLSVNEAGFNAFVFNCLNQLLSLMETGRGFLDPLGMLKSPAGKTLLIEKLSLVEILAFELLGLSRVGAGETNEGEERDNEKRLHKWESDLKDFANLGKVKVRACERGGDAPLHLHGITTANSPGCDKVATSPGPGSGERLIRPNVIMNPTHRPTRQSSDLFVENVDLAMITGFF